MRAAYWNRTNKLFVPQTPRVPPYLTFLGRQTFGYVSAVQLKGDATAEDPAVETKADADPTAAAAAAATTP